MMPLPTRIEKSAYMHWAKTRSQARFNLASSGLYNQPLSVLGASLDDIEISGPSFYGFPPLREALARHCGVNADRICCATGTSMANFLAMAGALQPGDDVLIEHPAYELIENAAGFLQANVRHFRRDPDQGFALDPAEIERQMTPRTRLIVLTNVHNPSSAFTPEGAIAAIAETARRHGARVLVDEVYLDSVFDSSPRSAALLGDEFVVTNSLTKVYGLSGLRCGWVVGDPEYIERLWRLNDLFGVVPAHSAERLSLLALGRIGALRERARAILEPNRAKINQFLAATPALECEPVSCGVTAFPRVWPGQVEALTKLLREKYETTVVPGVFFDYPDHIRIAFGCPPETLEAGLERLGAALSEV